MENHPILLAGALLVSAVCHAQSEALMAQVADLKAQAGANGYSVVGEGFAMTWGDAATQQGQTYVFEEYTYRKGYAYIFAVIVEDCNGCDIHIEWHNDDGSFDRLNHTTVTNDRFTLAKYMTRAPYDSNARIRTFVMSPTLRPTYALIFEMPG